MKHEPSIEWCVAASALLINVCKIVKYKQSSMMRIPFNNLVKSPTNCVLLKILADTSCDAFVSNCSMKQRRQVSEEFHYEIATKNEENH